MFDLEHVLDPESLSVSDIEGSKRGKNGLMQLLHTFCFACFVAGLGHTRSCNSNMYLFRLREENLKKAKSLLRSGHSSQANEYFQRCVEITPAMATEVIQVRSPLHFMNSMFTSLFTCGSTFAFGELSLTFCFL